MTRLTVRLAIVLIGIQFATLTSSKAAVFDFESILSLDQMRAHLMRSFPLGTNRSYVRTHFVEQGKAQMYEHPERVNIEKYVYDINLCRIYVWRWNISANYDDLGKLTQIYLNGEAIHALGDGPRDPLQIEVAGAEQQILKVKRPRPEADLGENEIVFVVFDLDADTYQIDDQFVIGAGPSRADATNLGKLYVYSNVERWRSIFDTEPAREVVPYSGACPSGG